MDTDEADLARIQSEIAALEGQLQPEPVRRSGKRSRSGSSTPSSKDVLKRKIAELEKELKKETEQLIDPEELKMQKQIQKLEAKLKQTREKNSKSETKVVSRKPKAVTPKATKQPSRQRSKPAPPAAPVNRGPKLYCLCKTVYVESLPMIACDICDEWFHLSCLGMLSSEAVCIERYCCSVCKAKKKQKARTCYKSEQKMWEEISQMTGEIVTREIAVAEAELKKLTALDQPPEDEPESSSDSSDSSSDDD